MFRAAGRPLSIETVADPVPAADEVILAVAAAGICGSDLHFTQIDRPLPESGLVLGHEYAGTIVALGRDVGGGLKAGDRVTALPIFPCRACDACDAGLPALCPGGTFSGYAPDKTGGFAQFVAARGAMVQKLPAGVGFDEGALVEPLAVGHHAVARAGLRRGEAVLILGGGPIGAAVALFARAAGAAHVVVSEPFPARRERVAQAGATAVVDPAAEAVDAAFPRLAGKQPDVVFECVGLPGMLAQAVELAGIRARVVVAGVVMGEDRLVPLTALGKEVTILYSQAYTEQDFAAVIDAIARREVDPAPLHTATVGLDALPAMFESLRTASPQCKVLIDPAL
ncbi:alcohol dehydrogenase catalytic domain-containing protein [Sphingomonas jatrophae]|uniref:alcohol dehydrogenase catalytic domain-containing protein n=1 Tax=Sphingomonas jatrophae TaxID=1166337 RepID=UPI001F6052E1|nr:alcohol dehydrogenase catalytic domain-containing protein [Sphingomonas jatrophae]